MFPSRYFNPRYWAGRFWPRSESAADVERITLNAAWPVRAAGRAWWDGSAS